MNLVKVRNQKVSWGKVPVYENAGEFPTYCNRTQKHLDFCREVEERGDPEELKKYSYQIDAINRLGVAWITPFVFHAQSVHISGYTRGTSAARFEVVIMDEDDNEIKAQMFLTDMIDLLHHCIIEYGVVEDKDWEFTKRGKNYGIRLAEK